jgi:MoxR-like ATPase
VPADAGAGGAPEHAPADVVPPDAGAGAPVSSEVAPGDAGGGPAGTPLEIAAGGAAAPSDAWAAPDVAAPEVAAPQVAAPQVAAPEVAAPEVAAREVAAPEVAAPEPVSSVPPPVGAVVRDELGGGGFVDARAVRVAAEEAGLRLPVDVYANVVAALASGRHLLLAGAPGAGKTTLALAVARAAAQGGRAQGATVVTAGPEAAAAVTEAGRRGRWLVLDDLDRVDPDAVLGPLATFLGGWPVTLAGKEVAPAADWRLVATWSGPLPRASVLRRFAVVEVSGPPAEALRSALRAAAQGDATAAAAAERLLALADAAPVGAGVFLAAARHAAARNAAAPADAATLAREAYAAHLAPLLGDAAGERVRDLLDDAPT